MQGKACGPLSLLTCTAGGWSCEGEVASKCCTGSAGRSCANTSSINDACLEQSMQQHPVQHIQTASLLLLTG